MGGLFSGNRKSDEETLPVAQDPNAMPRPSSSGTGRPSTVHSGPISRPGTSSKNGPTPKPGLNRSTSANTRYVEMLLSLDEVPRLHNLLTAFFSWVLLAGFLVFPGTFTSLKDYTKDNSGDASSIGNKIVHEVANIPLLWIAGACCIFGALGMLWLWIVWRNNYVWLINRIFMPGLLHSFAGLISTLVNIYTAQGGTWSITAKATAIVTGACTGVFLILFLLYSQWALKSVQRSHVRDMQQINHPEHETVGEKVNRIAHEKPLAPNSVV